MNGAPNFTASPTPVAPAIGDNIEVPWPLETQCFRVTDPDILDTGMHDIIYDDADKETLTLSNETWRSCSITAACFMLTPTLTSCASDVLKIMFNVFGNCSLLFYQAQDFPQYVTIKAH